MRTLNFQIFNEIRLKNIKSMDKIKFVGGDITVDGLLISEDDEFKIIKDVNIIFHCAASIKFNDSIKNAVNINVSGTLRVLKLAEKVKNLETFSYISTAFCQSYQEELMEKHYKTNVDALEVIEKIKKVHDKDLVQFEKKL
jgi:alcohol-forming fatty acyl-CoA reductase